MSLTNIVSNKFTKTMFSLRDALNIVSDQCAIIPAKSATFT